MPRLLLLGVLALGAVSCERAESASLASTQQQAVTSATAPAFAPEKVVTVEFDAAPEWTAKGPNGRPLVSTFQVGFFAGSRLVRAIEIPRDSVRLVSGKIRLEVPLTPVLQAEDSSVALKVRPLSSGRLGPWSDAAGSVSLPVQARQRRGAADTQRSGAKGGADRPAVDSRQRSDAAKGGSDARPGQSRRRLQLADIEKHEALKTLLAQSLDSSLTLEQAVGSFAKVQDVATAALLAQRLKLPFAKISQAVDATPKKSLVEGLKALQPSINAQAEIKAVVPEAKKLIGRQRQPRSKPAAAKPPAAQ